MERPSTGRGALRGEPLRLNRGWRTLAENPWLARWLDTRSLSGKILAGLRPEFPSQALLRLLDKNTVLSIQRSGLSLQARVSGRGQVATLIETNQGV